MRLSLRDLTGERPGLDLLREGHLVVRVAADGDGGRFDVHDKACAVVAPAPGVHVRVSDTTDLPRAQCVPAPAFAATAHGCAHGDAAFVTTTLVATMGCATTFAR